MAFVTISTWTFDKTMDEATLISETKTNLSRIKQMGAEHGYFVGTGPGEAVAIVVYPDRATRDRARETVLAIRANANRDHSAKVTGEQEGEALAAI